MIGPPESPLKISRLLTSADSPTKVTTPPDTNFAGIPAGNPVRPTVSPTRSASGTKSITADSKPSFPGGLSTCTIAQSAIGLPHESFSWRKVLIDPQLYSFSSFGFSHPAQALSGVDSEEP